MKPQLAADRMTREQLWTWTWRRVFDLDPENLQGLEYREKQRAHRQLREVLREIEIRGDQLALGNLGCEQVTAHGAIHRSTSH